MTNIKSELLIKIGSRIILGLILMIILRYNANAQTIGYIVEWNSLDEIDFDAINILRNTKINMELSSDEKINISYDKNSGKLYGFNITDEVFIFDLINFKTEKIITELSKLYNFGYNELALNPIKNQIFIGTQKGKEKIILIYDLNSNSYIEIKDNYKYHRFSLFTSDGKYMYCIPSKNESSENVKIEKRNTNNFELINTFYIPVPELSDFVTIGSFILSSDNRRLYISIFLKSGENYINKITIMNTENGEIIKELLARAKSTLSNDGKYLYLIYQDIDTGENSIQKMDTNNFTIIKESLLGKLNIGGSIAVLSPDDSLLILGTGGGNRDPGFVTIIDANELKVKGRINLKTSPIAIYFK